MKHLPSHLRDLPPEEIRRRQATFRDDGQLLLPTIPCPRCTPPGQLRGRGEVWIYVDRKYVKCSKCNGKGYIVKGKTP